MKKISGVLAGFRERSQQKAFVDLLMAGVALVATADRDQHRSELVTRERILGRLTHLQPVDRNSAVATYDQYARQLSEDPVAGREGLMAKLSKFRGTTEEAGTLIRACLAVGHADLDFSPAERSVVEQVCRVLGTDPHEFGVYDI
ncbi:MAG: tellurite resistance TerB family protein [Myxococcota bacterium]|nr:tellurite resistance TerB family protein [Myxococcota bacterium]